MLRDVRNKNKMITGLEDRLCESRSLVCGQTPILIVLCVDLVFKKQAVPRSIIVQLAIIYKGQLIQLAGLCICTQ